MNLPHHVWGGDKYTWLCSYFIAYRHPRLSSAPVVLTETRNDSYLLCKWLILSFFQRPTLGANVNFSASNGLYIDIPVLWPAPYLKFQTLPGAYKRQSVNVEGEVYRGTGCIISSRASPNLHWHSVSSQPSPPYRPAGLDFSPAYIRIACMYCLRCSSRKTGGRGSAMPLLCCSLGAGSWTSSWLQLEIWRLKQDHVQCFKQTRLLPSPKNATHWCCGFQKSPPSVPVFLGNSTWGTRCCPNMVWTWCYFCFLQCNQDVAELRSCPNHQGNKIFLTLCDLPQQSYGQSKSKLQPTVKLYLRRCYRIVDIFWSP